MKITYDPEKRRKTLDERGIDFEDALQVFGGEHLSLDDPRNEYGERRVITVGFLMDRMVIVVWTPREDSRRIISMRKANERETRRYAEILGQ